ncbi:hypothetical protein [Plantactinospora sp. GCM10030261]|uniref:hypothetical protein n=1 Tax=Plantactinospora sp. GCM10030261 TaxID=3273420 RepID=UPI0036177D2D
MAAPPGGKSKRWLWITLSAVLAVALVCTGSAFGLRSYVKGKNDTAAAVRYEENNPIKPEEVKDLMDERTRALKDGDENAFLAAFDPANKKLVDQQRNLFRNLRKLPLAKAGFQQRALASRVVLRDVKPVGAGFTVDFTLSFVHQLDGYDRHPVDELYTWTIFRPERGAPLTVTAVKGHTGEKPEEMTYHPAPWDKWSTIHVERTEHTLFIVDVALRAEAQRYAPIAERAAAANLAAWQSAGVPGDVPKGFVISLVKGKKGLATLYRTTNKTPPESGFSFGVPQYDDIDREDDDYVVGGSRVVIDVTDRSFFRAGDREGPAEIFRHELAHSLAHGLTKIGNDAILYQQEKWLVEGFAEYFGHERKSWTTSDRAASGRSRVRATKLGNLLLPNNVGWDRDGRTSYHYWLGHSAVSYMVEKYGERKAFEVVAEHYRGQSLEQVMPKVLGLKYFDFDRQWAAYVKSKVG